MVASWAVAMCCSPLCRAAKPVPLLAPLDSQNTSPPADRLGVMLWK